MTDQQNSQAGRARVPILIGLAGAFALMAAAILVVITTGDGQAGASPMPGITAGVTSSALPTESLAPDETSSAEPSAPVLGCSDAGDPTTTADQVLVYFTCEQPPADPRAVVRIHPGVDDVNVRLRFALEQLLAGPTDAESDLGYSSFVPPGSQDLLMSVSVGDDGLAVVDFTDDLRRRAVLNTGHNSFLFFGTLGATIFQFEEIAAVEFRIAGSCEAFARHFGTICEPWPR